MNISYNWLREFINLKLSPEETAEKLTLIGLEVDEVSSFGNLLEGVIVGEVLEVKEHSNADRLQLCTVNLGEVKVQIVCGADNVAAGQKVPVATIGTILQDPRENGNSITIKKTSLRGEESHGMICSEDELGLGSDRDGIMVLDEKLKVGTPIHEALNITRDTIFDIELTPNRPDAACHLGVARDLSAALNLDLNKPFSTELKKSAAMDEDGIDIDIQIKRPEKCHRYVGMVIKEITVGESPRWIKNRLKAIGIRPVNNIVDITNYVMFELGQPMHAFDMDKISGQKIIVRDFEREIEFETLDHVKRDCSPGTLFICDSDKPIAIAGVMGGADSEVSETTKHILLESAWFDPVQTRKTAKEQNLQTDASYRFERGVDPSLQLIAAQRAAELIIEIAGGTPGGFADIHPVPEDPVKITLRTSYVNRLLGTEFTLDKIFQIIDGLGLKEIKKDEKSITFRIPSFRPDLEREVDLIEEVGRLYDYNNIPTPRYYKFRSPEDVDPWEEFKQKAISTARALRFREIYSNSLMPEKDAKLLGNPEYMIHTMNPISADMTTLRPSLLYGFLKAVSYNFNRNIKGIRFFETGNVFKKSNEGTFYEHIREETHLLMGVAGLKNIEHWKTDPQIYDVFDIKASLNNFLNQFCTESNIETQPDGSDTLEYFINNKKMAVVRQLDKILLKEYDINQPAFIAEISLSTLYNVVKESSLSYEPVSKFPPFEFDFAVIVDSDIRAGEVMAQIRKAAPDSLKDLNIFDVFEGESLGPDKKSLAFRLSFIDKNKTLTINEVEPIIKKILNILEDKFSAKLRS